MNSSLFQFCRQLAQQLLTVLLGLVFVLSVLFALRDSGESVLIHKVAVDAQPSCEPSYLHLRFEESTLKLEVQLGVHGGIFYQRRLLAA